MTNKPANAVAMESLMMMTPKVRYKVSCPRQTKVPDELGKYVQQDMKEVDRLVWETFVTVRRGHGEFTSLENRLHPARGTLCKYKHQGGWGGVSH